MLAELAGVYSGNEKCLAVEVQVHALNSAAEQLVAFGSIADVEEGIAVDVALQNAELVFVLRTLLDLLSGISLHECYQKEDGGQRSFVIYRFKAFL